jgi:dUTP pyrophosphatase
MYYEKKKSLTKTKCSNCAHNCAYCTVDQWCEHQATCHNYDAMRACTSCINEKNFTSFYPTEKELQQTVNIIQVSTPDTTLIPKKQYTSDSGFDLCAAEDSFVYPDKFKAINTGIKIALPPGFEGQVRSRSDLAAEYGVAVLNAPGTIDQGFRGEIKVILMNHGTYTFFARKGARIAQLVIKPVYDFEFKHVFKLSITDRGGDGIGSTGV